MLRNNQDSSQEIVNNGDFMDSRMKKTKTQTFFYYELNRIMEIILTSMLTVIKTLGSLRISSIVSASLILTEGNSVSPGGPPK